MPSLNEVAGMDWLTDNLVPERFTPIGFSTTYVDELPSAYKE